MNTIEINFRHLFYMYKHDNDLFHSIVIYYGLLKVTFTSAFIDCCKFYYNREIFVISFSKKR